MIDLVKEYIPSKTLSKVRLKDDEHAVKDAKRLVEVALIFQPLRAQ